MSPLTLLALIGVAVAASPVIQWLAVDGRRRRALRAFGRRRGSLPLALVHRQEQVAVLGLPVLRYVTCPLGDELGRAIARAPRSVPVDLIVHLPGGVPFDAGPVAEALAGRRGAVTVWVPACGLSGLEQLVAAATLVLVGPDAAVEGVAAAPTAPIPPGELHTLLELLSLYPQPARVRVSPLFLPLAGVRRRSSDTAEPL
jgi:hypothetical protein